MILNIYAFYDKKAQELVNPVFMKNEEVLKRSLTQAFNQPNQGNMPFIDYPDDFDVYKVGEFDTFAVYGNVEKTFKPEFVFNVAECKPVVKEVDKE